MDDTRLLVPKTSKKTFAARSFSILGPTLWNELPRDLRKITMPASRRNLKHTSSERLTN